MRNDTVGFRAVRAELSLPIASVRNPKPSRIPAYPTNGRIHMVSVVGYEKALAVMTRGYRP